MIVFMLMAQFAVIMHYPSHLHEGPAHEKQDGYHHDCALCVTGSVINNSLLPVAALLILASAIRIFGRGHDTSSFSYHFLKSRYSTGPPGLS